VFTRDLELPQRQRVWARDSDVTLRGPEVRTLAPSAVPRRASRRSPRWPGPPAGPASRRPQASQRLGPGRDIPASGGPRAGRAHRARPRRSRAQPPVERARRGAAEGSDRLYEVEAWIENGALSLFLVRSKRRLSTWLWRRGWAQVSRQPESSRPRPKLFATTPARSHSRRLARRHRRGDSPRVGRTATQLFVTSPRGFPPNVTPAPSHIRFQRLSRATRRRAIRNRQAESP
jgi:hypothetical protein